MWSSRNQYIWSLLFLTFIFFFSCAYLAFQDRPIVAFKKLPSYFDFVHDVHKVPEIPQVLPVTNNVTNTTEADPTILFTGDVLLARKVERYMNSEGEQYPFKFIAPLLRDSIATIINFEAAIPSKHKPTRDLTTQFSVNSLTLGVLADSGITHASLANNHSGDFGLPGYVNTREMLHKNKITTFGHYQDVSSSSVTIIKLGTKRVGVIAIHAALIDASLTDIAFEIKQLSAVTDIQIAYIHWGEEYSLHHSKKQEALAIELAKMGIDAIIGHHPHVVQDIQIVSGIPVFYSLGNFVFDQYFSTEVQTGLLLTLALASTSLDFTLVPIDSLENQSQPQKMGPVDSLRFLAQLAARSDPKYTDSIKQGKLILPLRLATSTE